MDPTISLTTAVDTVQLHIRYITQIFNRYWLLQGQRSTLYAAKVYYVSSTSYSCRLHLFETSASNDHKNSRESYASNFGGVELLR